MFSPRARFAVLSCAAAGLLLLSGCGDNNAISNPGAKPTTTAPLASGGPQTAFAAVNNTVPVVVQYAATSSGSPLPLSSFNISVTTDLEAMAVDKNTGTIYITGFSYTDNQPEVWAYAAGSTGTATPVRTILMGLTATTEPYDITVDATGNVYVAVQDYNSGLGSVVEYSSTATGTATPVRTISGATTGIAMPVALAVDTAGTLYVASVTGQNSWTGTILEFASGATGNVAPLRTITAGNQFFFGVAVDANLNLYATQESGNGQYLSNASLVEFAPGASGAATPAKTITSPAIGGLGGVQVDSVGNLFTVNYGASTASLLGFGPASTGYATPSVTLTPSALTSSTTTSVALY